MLWHSVHIRITIIQKITYQQPLEVVDFKVSFLDKIKYLLQKKIFDFWSELKLKFSVVGKKSEETSLRTKHSRSLLNLILVTSSCQQSGDHTLFFLLFVLGTLFVLLDLAIKLFLLDLSLIHI